MSIRTAGLCLALTLQTAGALTAVADPPRYTFRIAAGSLDAALKRYARITGQQILYRGVVVGDRRFGGLDAELGADAALTRILDGSGLRALHPAPDVIVIEREQALADTSPGPVQADVVVTGSNIRDGTPTISVRSLSRQELERSGKGTIGDAIAALPGNFGGTGNPVASLTGADRSTLNYSVAPAANLRGLGSDATLTLFDGRRIAGSGGRGDFTDLSAIPTMAVDRVEILADGASAIYGSDAVGGVVNLILRHRVRGLEVRARGLTATDGSFRNALGGAIAGQDWSTGGAVIAYEFEHRDALSAADRPYAATGDLRPFGGTDHRLFYSSPATILAFSPTAGTYVPTYGVPALPPGITPTIEQIVAGENLYNPVAGLDLSPGIDRHAVYAHADQQLGRGVSVFLDVRFAHRSFSYDAPASIAPFVVTTANPYFLPVGGQPFSILAYSFYPELGSSRARGKVSSLGLTGGLDWSIDAGWAFSGYANFARERSRDRTFNFVNSSALDEATGTAPDDPATPFSTATAGFFNPYGSGTLNNRAVLDFIGSGYVRLHRRSSIADATIKVDGPLFDAGGGDARLALGGSVRRETFAAGGETFYSGTRPSSVDETNGGRTIKAAFAELNLPIFGRTNAKRGLALLTVSAAIRYEQYSDFGSTTNPKFGAAWSPTDGVTLRANWGTSFRAPALTEINERRSVSPTQLPNGSGGYAPVIVVGGGNPELGPERATTWTGGITLEPPAAKNLRFDFGLFSTRFKDRIGQPAYENILRALTNPALAPFVKRVSPLTSAADLALIEALLAEPNAASAGGLPASAFQAIIDGRYVNTGRLDVSGLDMDVAFGKTFGIDRIDVALSATWLFHYRTQATPLSPILDKLDTLGNPVGVRARGSIGWTHGPWSANAYGNWTSDYRNDSVTPITSVRSFFTLDATLAYAPARGLLSGTRVVFAVENMFDAAPPFADRASGIGFDASNANPFGRTIALELRHRF